MLVFSLSSTVAFPASAGCCSRSGRWLPTEHGGTRKGATPVIARSAATKQSSRAAQLLWIASLRSQ